jgi:hypothetical protein
MTFQTFHISGQKEGLFFWGKVEKNKQNNCCKERLNFQGGILTGLHLISLGIKILETTPI